MNGSPDYFPRNASLKLRDWKAGKSEKQQNLTKISLHLLSFQGTQSFSGDGLPETHRPDALHHDLELRGHRQGHRNGPLRPVPHGTAAAATDLLKEAPPGEGRLVLQATQQGRQLLVSQHCQGRRELTKFPKVRLCLVTLYFYEFFGTFPSLILEEDLCIEVATELHGSQCLICGSLLKAHRTIQHTESCQRHNFRSLSTIQGSNDTSGTQKPPQPEVKDRSPMEVLAGAKGGPSGNLMESNTWMDSCAFTKLMKLSLLANSCLYHWNDRRGGAASKRLK